MSIKLIRVKRLRALLNMHLSASQMISEHYRKLMVLKPEHGTYPHVFYLGMDDRFISRPHAKPAIWDLRD